MPSREAASLLDNQPGFELFTLTAYVDTSIGANNPTIVIRAERQAHFVVGLHRILRPYVAGTLLRLKRR